MAITKQTSGELKSRVNNCIDKLSDRDTLSMAANELEAIARTLPNDAFAPFLNCLSATDSSEKSPVRRHCVRLIGVLSAAHGDALSPHVSRMISAVLRRLRDPDSAVQSACVDAVASIAAHVNSPPFAVMLKPLVDTLFHEQDLKPQIGAALCLSAAVEAAPEPDLPELRKLLPRVLKLVKSDCCKAKPALLSVVGSVVGSDCVKSKNLLSSIVSTAVDFLSSEDWAARKEAAEVLEKVAVACRSLAAEFKASCVAALESRRFDKVKLVREKMNRALEIWKDLPEQSEDVASPNVESDSSSACESPENVPQARKMHQTRSGSCSWSSSSSSSRKSIAGNEDNRPCIPSSSKLNLKKNIRSRVVPFDITKSNLENLKEFEDMSLIRRQLQQIENQQSNLLDLLQRFMGSSQKGMSSLEQRVDGLEKVLDVMSHDFAISTRRISAPTAEPLGNTCCMIPGADFLSPKFWRKAEPQTVLASTFRNYQPSQCKDATHAPRNS
ncbi:ARM repeat superfamily protein [Perilla frutescens var. hirtella]|uniref:ARM repeat superfamily protein n=1 Tax=Perilla frutescens var. hirtella TaxID=608512 RepID=A0AAD4NX38_PERFH|nr:ARM repeat superfamily protein [Perilla frutescens var. hirtella]